MFTMTTTNDPGTSGIKNIAEALGGGIKEGSLVIIDGEAHTGKSVLCQHIVAGILSTRGSQIAYYSHEFQAFGLYKMMSSIGLNPLEDINSGRLAVFKIFSHKVVREATKSLELLVNHINRLPPQFKLVVVDSPSLYISRVSPIFKTDFLQACKEMCTNGRTIILAVETHAFESKSLLRAYAMSDYYLKLKSQDAILEAGKLDMRVIKVLEVTKLCGAERWHGEGMRFEIKPGVGIQILPFQRIKV
jgi:archaellum biogenesis ATPase FlaH